MDGKLRFSENLLLGVAQRVWKVPSILPVNAQGTKYYTAFSMADLQFFL